MHPTTPTPPATSTLHLSSGNGPVTRTVLSSPPREALPHEIPLIDISALTNPSSSFEARKLIAEQIRTAALINGFFYLTNHGISPSTTSAAHQSSLNFFRQPAEKKQPANSALYSKYHYGWKAPGSQRINPFEGIDKRESFSWRYDPRYDPLLSPEEAEKIPEEVRRVIEVDEGDFPWSGTTEHTPEFKKDFVALFQAVLGLGRLLARSFALSLGLEETEWDDKFTYPGLGMAINWYPALEAEDTTISKRISGQGGEHENVSIGSHTDFQLFTLLYQDPNSPPTALQVLSRCPEAGKTEDGEEIYQWLYAKPVPGTFVVNFGDYMQRITNDLYPSTVHRVQNFYGGGPRAAEDGDHESTAGNGERLSMAFFFGFNPNEVVEVLDSCVDVSKGEKKKYEAISGHEWTLRRLRAMHQVGPAGGTAAVRS